MAKTKKTKKPPTRERPVTSTPPRLMPCLWFDKDALEAAEYYVSIFPRSRITKVQRSPADNPSTRKGEILLVELKLDGKPFMALNGGPYFTINEAISFVVDVEDQAELDRYYEALSAVPEAEQCGWVKDRFGVSWQLTPRALVRHLASRDAAKAKRVFEAMMPMKRLDIEAIEAAAKKPRVAVKR